MQRGPVDVLAMAFPVATSADQMAQCLRKPVTSGQLHLIDLVFLLRGEDGTLEAVDVEQDRFPTPAVAGLALDAHTLLSDDDLVQLADSLGPDEHGMAAVVEHVWATDAKERLSELGARMTLLAHVPDEEVTAAFHAEDENV